MVIKARHTPTGQVLALKVCEHECDFFDTFVHVNVSPISVAWVMVWIKTRARTCRVSRLHLRPPQSHIYEHAQVISMFEKS